MAMVVSALCGLLMIPQILDFCKRKNLYDIPNARKVHKNAVPRLGGISFMPSMLVAFILAVAIMNKMTDTNQVTVSTWTCCFFISLLLIYGVGIVDDLIGLNAQSKFVVQIIAASLLPFSGLYINNLYGFLGIQEIPFWFGAPFTVFIIVFIDNAINLIDGIDGLAGGLSFLALCGFLYCFLYEGIFTYSILIAGLMGVLLSYLYFNIWGNPSKNRKIFMGDSGSLTLGFILGFLFVKYAMYNPEVMPYHKDGLMISITMQHQALVCILLLAVSYTLLNTLLTIICNLGMTYTLLIDVLLFFSFNYMVNKAILQNDQLPFVVIENN